MKGKRLNVIIFILSIICVVVSVKLFWNLSIYSDEFNTSPNIVLGGDLWLYMNWLRLGCSIVICTLSAISLTRKTNKL